MEFEKTLQLAFSLVDGKSSTITIKDPKESLTEQEVHAAIATIVSQQAFTRGGGAYVAAKSAKIIERTVTPFEL